MTVTVPINRGEWLAIFELQTDAQGSFIPRRQTNPHNKEVHGTAEYTRSASQFSIVLVLDCQPFRMWISVIPEGRDLGSAVLGIVICPQFALQRLTRKVDKRQQTMHAFKSASGN